LAHLIRINSTKAQDPDRFFLMTLLTLLIFLCITNTDILGMMGLMALSFVQARILFRVDVNIFNWLLIVLKGTKALQGSTGTS
jgi:hypothetical protein